MEKRRFFERRRAIWLSRVGVFHPIAWVRQMMLINGTKLETVLKEMKKLVDKHIPYSQQGERASLSEEGMKELDCSETVGIYLHKLGVMPKYKAIHTGLMTTQTNFRKAVGSNKIEYIQGSDKADFIPESGDIFVWRDKNHKPRPDGHTGIVYKYDSISDLVIVLEAIGKDGARGESQQVANGGEAIKGCTRTAIYLKTSDALCLHPGWVGYFRPILK